MDVEDVVRRNAGSKRRKRVDVCDDGRREGVLIVKGHQLQVVLIVIHSREKRFR